MDFGPLMATVIGREDAGCRPWSFFLFMQILPARRDDANDRRPRLG